MVDGFRAVLWLDDSPEHHDTPQYRDGWRGYLFAFLLLRALPQVLFLTKNRARPELYESLAHMRMAASNSSDEAWSALDVGLGFEAIVKQLADAEVATPEVGLDLPDKRGLSSGVEGELVWEDRRVAVVRDLDDKTRSRIASDWTVFSLAQLADITPLVTALRGGPQGDPS
jgi:hypothetical protein